MLQRFYHQQNQLREKELERQQQQQKQQMYISKISHIENKTNPFLNNYMSATNTSSSNLQQPQSLPSQLNSNFYHTDLQLPLNTAPSTSSHSTSSQSSTQSSSSQQLAPTFDQRSPVTPPTAAVGTFGLCSNSNLHSGTLQYQQLPQQYMTLNSLRHSRSPPASLSPEQQQQPNEINAGLDNAAVAGGGGGGASKLSRLYAARKNLQSTASAVDNSAIYGASKENSFKDDNGKSPKIFKNLDCMFNFQSFIK